jgi:hypothetical protein
MEHRFSERLGMGKHFSFYAGKWLDDREALTFGIHPLNEKSLGAIFAVFSMHDWAG